MMMAGAIAGDCVPVRWQPAKWRPRTEVLPRQRHYSMSRSPSCGPGVVANDRWCSERCGSATRRAASDAVTLKPSMSGRQSGFTLLEMLIALVVLGFLMVA